MVSDSRIIAYYRKIKLAYSRIRKKADQLTKLMLQVKINNVKITKNNNRC